MKRLGMVACGVFVAGSLLLMSPAALAQHAPHSGGGGARAAAPAGGGSHAQAVPRGGRPVGGRPIAGSAVPRGAVPGYHPPYYRPYYRPYYGWGSYGYPYYGYGYGYPWSFGLSFYYDPFWWGFGLGSPWYGYAPYGGYGYAPYGGYGYAPYGGYGSYWSGHGGDSNRPAESPTGQIQLKVKLKEAQVYVDGYFVGSVEDFDGWGKRLTVKAAPEPGQVHKIEFRYPGYETLSFEVSMTPGQSITYRGELKKAAPEQPIR